MRALLSRTINSSSRRRRCASLLPKKLTPYVAQCREAAAQCSEAAAQCSEAVEQCSEAVAQGYEAVAAAYNGHIV